MKLHQVIIFLSIISCVYFLIYYYFYRRFIVPLPLSASGKTFAKIALFLIMFSSFIPFFLIRFRSAPVDAASWMAYLWFGFIFTLFPLSVSRDILSILGNGIRKIKNLWLKGGLEKSAKKSSNDTIQTVTNQTSGIDISRKDFLIKSNYALIASTAVMGGFGVNEARQLPKVYRTKIPIPGLPDHLVGFKIAQISDVHVGLLIDGKYLAEVVRRVNGLEPDIIAVTGDLMDGSVAQLRQETACLMDLVAARGKYFITGNHEYYSGVEEWLDEIDRLGIKTLMNTNEVIRDISKKRSGAQKSSEQNLVIAGVPDHREGKSKGHIYDPVGALKGAQRDDIKILLAHQPVAVDQSLEAGYHLQISGHTHGGQFFPYNMLVGLVYPYNAGLYSHVGPNKDDKMWVYVNRGTGFWGPPLRLGVPAEITLLTLERA